MNTKKLEEKIQKLRQELNQLANQLIQQSPEGQRIAGQIEAYEAVVADLKAQGQEPLHEGP